MSEIRIPWSEIARAAAVAGASSVVSGPVAFVFNGVDGLVWALGWALTAGFWWSLVREPRFGLVQGVAAGLAVGVGLGPVAGAAGLLLRLVLPGLIWGTAGGIGGAFVLMRPVAGFGGLVAPYLLGSFIVGVFATILVGIIGDVSGAIGLGGAGFLVGVVLMSPSWAIGTTVGIAAGSLARSFATKIGVGQE